MLRGKGTMKDGKPLIVLGLSYKNLEKMKAGEPMSFDLDELGINAHCLIVVGETEEAMAEDFGLPLQERPTA